MNPHILGFSSVSSALVQTPEPLEILEKCLSTQEILALTHHDTRNHLLPLGFSSVSSALVQTPESPAILKECLSEQEIQKIFNFQVSGYKKNKAKQHYCLKA